jgi:hypothetical protein
MKYNETGWDRGDPWDMMGWGNGVRERGTQLGESERLTQSSRFGFVGVGLGYGGSWDLRWARAASSWVSVEPAM